MSAMQRRKGATAEQDLVRWLRGHGYPDARRYLAGDGRQPGDIDGVPGHCIEIKNQAVYDIPAWLRQVEAEAGHNVALLVVRPRGEVDPARWWVVQRVGAYFELEAVAS